MLNLNEYIESYNNNTFKVVAKQRLEEKYGHIPNIQKDERYESILISVFHELKDKNYFFKIIEELIYEFYEEKNLIGLKNILKLYNEFHQSIQIKDIFPESLDFSIQNDIQLNLLILQFLSIAKLKKESFWHSCYFKILDYFQDSKDYIELLSTVISVINSYSTLNTADMWNRLYLSLANINTNTTSLLLKIIINQWVLSSKNKLNMNEFINTLTSMKECDFKPLEVSINKEFNNYLESAIDFLLKHHLEEKQKATLNEFKKKIKEIRYLKNEKDINSRILELTCSQPKYSGQLILNKLQNDDSLFQFKRTYMISKTPAMIMAVAE